jgi:histidinol dehydrogenase
MMTRIRNAGAIFVGPYSPEPLGDYIAGPNHTLPTSGTARFASALSTTDFLKKISVIRFDREGLSRYQDAIVNIATEEGLTAHANAVSRRFQDED